MDISDLRKVVDDKRQMMFDEVQVIIDAQLRAFRAVVADHPAVRNSSKLTRAIDDVDDAMSQAYQLAANCKWGD
jgi:hypothetical protein